MCKTTELLLLPCIQEAGAGEAAAQGGGAGDLKTQGLD
jgi:hypothetical protein